MTGLAGEFLRETTRLLLVAWALAGGVVQAAVDDSKTGDPFDVFEYRVRGNTLLSPTQVERTVYPHLGPSRSVADVEKARTALEQAFREAGYPTVFVNLPEQEVTNGTVLLVVTEGRVGQFGITGSRYFRNGWIRDQIPEVAPGRIPRLNEFQRQLAAVNQRSADRNLTPILRPGRDPGTVDVELKVEDQLPLHASLEVNNRNSADTTDTRVNAAVRYDNLWQRDHSLSLQYQVAPEDKDESEVWVASYVLRPMNSRNTFAFYAVDSKSDVATVGGDVNVLGDGNIYGARAIFPLPAGESLYHSLVLGLDYKDFNETLGFTEEGEEDIDTPIAYLNASVGWNGTIVGESLTQNLAATLNFGVRGGANEDQEFADKRFQARPNYAYLNASYDLLQPIWWDTRFFWSVTGQLAAQPLISNEQFAAGGQDSVRGYYEAEMLGDWGVQTTLEWRSPELGKKLADSFQTLYGFVFADAAELKLNDPLPGQVTSESLASAGLGLRANALGFVAGVDWAWPLRDGSTTEANDDRLLFSLKYGF